MLTRADSLQNHSPATSPLGRDVAVPQRYDPRLLFPIPRSQGRSGLGLEMAATLPFGGHDRWQAYELGWLDAHGKPVVATATFYVPATSPCLIESKSLKLYLNSFNTHCFAHPEQARTRIAEDLGQAAGAAVAVSFGLPPMEENIAVDVLDEQAIDIDHYGPPRPDVLRSEEGDPVDQSLYSGLFKSNCPVTGQPDWASLRIDCHGPRIDRAGLLRYLMSFRNHADFHEQCVERIFIDILARCHPQQLSVEARYTRRGGLDINPWRGTPGILPPKPRREWRQ